MSKVGFVVIGRNEGERLKRALAALSKESGPVVYVDSGSVDGSVDAAQAFGAHVVRLPMDRPFTAARARNEGFQALQALSPALNYVQFIDGDCELAPDWVEKARAFLDANPDFAAVAGRRRERFPERSLYNRLCDAEWATPAGETNACGGDVLMRCGAFAAAGGFRDGLIAGEEPELCLRLREKGWRIFRLDAEMTLHDAAMTRFSQWWRRSARAGHAFAEVSAIHEGSPKRIWARETARALIWSAAAPAALIPGVLAHPAFFFLLLVYPAQVIRLAVVWRKRYGRDALVFAAMAVIGKFAEAEGVLSYWLLRLRGKRAGLYEYKTLG